MNQNLTRRFVCLSTERIMMRVNRSYLTRRQTDGHTHTHTDRCIAYLDSQSAVAADARRQVHTPTNKARWKYWHWQIRWQAS